MRYRVIQEHDRRDPTDVPCVGRIPRGVLRVARTSRKSAGCCQSYAARHNPSAPSGESPDLRQSEHLAGPPQARAPGWGASRGAADAPRWPPGQDREEMAGHHPIESPLARGGEHAATPVHSVATQPGLGRRYHLQCASPRIVGGSVCLECKEKGGFEELPCPLL
jgi:hypothetical protein